MSTLNFIVGLLCTIIVGGVFGWVIVSEQIREIRNLCKDLEGRPSGAVVMRQRHKNDCDCADCWIGQHYE